ncbi:hypothetical protein BD310DRAFT_938805, partial [Dichomitus squalens]
MRHLPFRASERVIFLTASLSTTTATSLVSLSLSSSSTGPPPSLINSGLLSTTYTARFYFLFLV